MCVVSMVHDHYKPLFERYTPPQTVTFAPTIDLAELRRLVEDFKAAVEAAKKVDTLTAQPDCEDPEKVRLQDRVAELEKKLALVQEAAK